MRDAASAVLSCGIEGLELNKEELRFFSLECPAGVTLFRWNIPQDPIHFRQVKKLISSIQATRIAGEGPRLISIDQEGGRVSRLPAPFPNRGPALHLFDGRDDAEALRGLKDYARDIAIGLNELGFNINFAPVCDVLSEESNTAIGDRVFALSAGMAAKRAGAFMDGLHTGGVLSCLKHFPGQGAATKDTHKSAATIDADYDLLMARDVAAFKDLIPRAPMVMPSHCLYPALDHRPAILSPKIIQEMLRRDLGFKGVVVSDDMIMEAINQDESVWGEQLCAAVAAGIDLLLVCKSLDRARLALESLRREMGRGFAFRPILENAAKRVESMRQTIKA